MNFLDFFFYRGKPSIFFAVQCGALASFFVLYFIFRKNREKTEIVMVEKVVSWVPSVILIVLIFVLALSSFLDTGFSYLAGVLCVIAGIVSIIWQKITQKASIIKGLKGLDWETTFFLMGIFVIVSAITVTGWIGVFSDFLSGLVGGNIFLGYTIIVVMSVVISAFVDNVPFLAAMLPVAISMSVRLNIEPTLFLFGLLIGASLGGNITPIGASANIVACGLLRKEGHEVGFKDFMKIGLPFTFAAVLAAYLFVWFIWGA